MVKVTVHYTEGDDESLHTALKLTLPKKWLAQPTDKVRDFFVESFNKKHPDHALDAADTHLEHKNGTEVPHDGTSDKYLVDKEEIFLRAGKGVTATEFEARIQKEKEDKAAEERKKKEAANSLLACKRFGCNARYREEDNHDTACTYHEKPPIFHETAKWWSCCPQKKAYDWETFQAIPGCRVGRHTNEDNKGKKFLGGGDLRAEAGEGQQKLKKIEDFNAGPSKPMTNEGKLEALKVAMSEVGVPKALFEEVYDSMCAKHEVQDLSKDLWKVSKEFGDILTDALKKTQSS